MNEFVKDGDYVLLNSTYAEVYIPKDLIGDPEKGNPTTYFYGEGVRTVGLFNIRCYNSDTADRNSAKLRTFNYPNTITMYPTEHETEKLQLSPDMDEDTYEVFKFYKGDIIMDRKAQQQSSQNCEEFLNFLIRGKLPKGLSYDDLYFGWQKNFKINNVNPGVPAVTLQTIISENCRSKKDPMKQFRKVVEEPGTTMYDYRVHNMVNICSNSSVMNALIFERFGDMLTYALNMSKNDVKQNRTPLEEVLTM